jgi:hypothetical protein
MFSADTMFNYFLLVRMRETNVPVVLLDPGINGTASLLNVNLTTFAGYALHAWCFQSIVVFHGPKETSNFLRRKANRLVPGQHTANVIENLVEKGKKGDRSGLLRGGSVSLGGPRARRIYWSSQL